MRIRLSAKEAAARPGVGKHAPHLVRVRVRVWAWVWVRLAKPNQTGAAR